MRKTRGIGTLVAIITFSLAATASGAGWGKIMVPHSQVNIREQRSVDSRLKGQLRPGQPVKTDFLRGNWVAVFPVTEQRRDEALARGYVYAPLLSDPYPADASGSGVVPGTAPANPPPQEITTWGKLMAPLLKANIREKRSVDSRLKGQLLPGEPVRVDFLREDWVAVFPVTEQRRDEALARGYVYAPLLREQPPAAAVPVETRNPPAPSQTSAEPKGRLVVVEEIAFRAGEEGKERFFIRFDRFYTPFLSSVEGAKPRIVLEIPNTAALDRRWAAIETEGTLLKKVRGNWDPRTHITRIIIDMEPTKNYLVKPMFFEQSNTYCLEITEDRPGEGQP